MTTMPANQYPWNDQPVFLFKPKDPWSALTHFTGFLAAIIAMPFLLIKGAGCGNSTVSLVSYMIFMLSMILLYGASTSYHSFNISPRINIILKKLDHTSIFFLIAGTYTPVCLIALQGSVGHILLAVVWTIAAAGMIFKLCWVTCPKWVSSVMYTLMGWVCLGVMPSLVQTLSRGAFLWLLAGGLLYTAGAVIYAVKPKRLANKAFGNHEIFHCFVLAGSVCHFIVIYSYLTMIG